MNTEENFIIPTPTLEDIKNIEVVDPIIISETSNLNTMEKVENTTTQELTIEQLEAQLAAAKKKKAAQYAKEKKAYEEHREYVVATLMELAIGHHDQLQIFKQTCHVELDKQAKSLEAYGKMNKKSKGGFTITSADGKYQIKRRRDTLPVWDERSTKAVQLIKDFLSDTVKKADKKLYEILLSFLEKGKDGNMEYSRVMNLFQHEDKYKDERWKEGLRLIKESYTTHLKAYGYEFKVLNSASGKYETLPLNFSSL